MYSRCFLRFSATTSSPRSLLMHSLRYAFSCQSSFFRSCSAFLKVGSYLFRWACSLFYLLLFSWSIFDDFFSGHAREADSITCDFNGKLSQGNNLSCSITMASWPYINFEAPTQVPIVSFWTVLGDRIQRHIVIKFSVQPSSAVQTLGTGVSLSICLSVSVSACN